MKNLAPVTVINSDSESDWFLICEHASNDIPRELDNLGLDESIFSQHIAYDIGAKNITLALAKKLGATAIICNYSRLVIDCNRALSRFDFIPDSSDGITILANSKLSKEEKFNRVKDIYLPFHNKVSELLAKRIIDNPSLKIANIHSFTPMLAQEGLKRPWDVGFAYVGGEFGEKMASYIKAKYPQHCIGLNQPYDANIHKGYTLPVHSSCHEIDGFLVELRQNNIMDKEGVDYWSDILANSMLDFKEKG